MMFFLPLLTLIAIKHIYRGTTIYSSIFISCVIGLGFFSAARYALRRYDNYSRINALKEAFMTSIYLLILWFPLELFICFKILFLKKDMRWGKTAHGLIKEEEENIKREQEKVNN